MSNPPDGGVVAAQATGRRSSCTMVQLSLIAQAQLDNTSKTPQLLHPSEYFLAKKLKSAYLPWVVKYRLLILACFVALFATSCLLATKVKRNFVPDLAVAYSAKVLLDRSSTTNINFFYVFFPQGSDLVFISGGGSWGAYCRWGSGD